MSPEVIDPSPDTLRGAPSVPPEVETPAPVPPADQVPPKVDEELDEEGKPKRMGGFQKRIHKLTTRLAEQGEEIARLKAGQAAPPASETKASTKPEPPDENKFDSYSEYKAAELKFMEDLTDWKTKEAVKSLKESEQAEAAKAKEQEKAQEAQKSWTTRLAAAHEAHPDLEDLLDEQDLPATAAMMETITESEHGGELLYHLASHPEECHRIALLSPLAAAREIGRIEASIAAAAKPPEAKAPEVQRKTTSAPAPLQPLKGSGTATKDPSKLSDSEWLKAQQRR